MAVRLTSKGQVTIPKLVRDRLKLRAGDRLDFVIDADGAVRIVPMTTSVKELKGLAPPPKRVLTLEEMDHVIGSKAGN
jgi:AbrB family looped-hinge helix DNA binding protein